MAFTIGRTEAWEDGPYSVVQSGRNISFAVDLYAHTLDDMLSQRHQLLHMPVGARFPIVWDEDPDWDGIYELVSPVRVSSPETYLTTAFATASVQARRILNPRVFGEYTVTGLSSPATTTQFAAGFHGWDASAAITDHRSATAFGDDLSYDSRVSVASPDGGTDGEITYWLDSSLTAPQTVLGEHLADPKYFYWGHPTIEVQRSLYSQFYALTGRDTPDDPYKVRVQNGRVRWTYTPGTRYADLEAWSGTGWDAYAQMDFANAVSSRFTPGFRIVRNSPFDVEIRVGRFHNITSNRGYAETSVRLLRGSNVVWFGSTLGGNKTATTPHEVLFTEPDGSAMTMAAETYGMSRSAADSNGNQLHVWEYGSNSSVTVADATFEATTGVNTVGFAVANSDAESVARGSYSAREVILGVDD